MERFVERYFGRDLWRDILGRDLWRDILGGDCGEICGEIFWEEICGRDNCGEDMVTFIF